MKKYGFGFKYYLKATPKVYRVLGDSILAATTTITSGTLVQAILNVTTSDNINIGFVKVLLYTSLICSVIGAIGKFMSNFFGSFEEIK